MVVNKPRLIDSHCHISFENFQADISDVSARWREAGVESLVHACVEPSEIPGIKAMADKFPELRYSVGVHPLDTHCWDKETIPTLRSAAREDTRVVAIGELGLDLFKETNLKEQLSVLIPQLELAFELGLPVIVHCRDAASPMLEVLNELKSQGRCPKGVMHCWGGTPEEMESFLELGLYISFSGTVTFPKALMIHECARKVPKNRYLIETDSPFLAPVPKRGKRNEPAYVEHVAERLAELREESIADVAETSSANARKLFALP